MVARTTPGITHCPALASTTTWTAPKCSASLRHTSPRLVSCSAHTSPRHCHTAVSTQKLQQPADDNVLPARRSHTQTAPRPLPHAGAPTRCASCGGSKVSLSRPIRQMMLSKGAQKHDAQVCTQPHTRKQHRHARTSSCSTTTWAKRVMMGQILSR